MPQAWSGTDAVWSPDEVPPTPTPPPTSQYWSVHCQLHNTGQYISHMALSVHCPLHNTGQCISHMALSVHFTLLVSTSATWLWQCYWLNSGSALDILPQSGIMAWKMDWVSSPLGRGWNVCYVSIICFYILLVVAYNYLYNKVIINLGANSQMVLNRSDTVL